MPSNLERQVFHYSISSSIPFSHPVNLHSSILTTGSLKSFLISTVLLISFPTFFPFKKIIMQTLQKIILLLKQIFSDNKGNLSSTRIAMLIIVLWFIADWLMEFHSKGIYTLTWEKLTLLTSAFGLKATQNFSENQSGNNQ